MADYPSYITEIIPADLLDEMTDNRKESLTDMGIAFRGGVKDALTENPFATAQGQIVVSESETLWARLAREGRFRSGSKQGTTLTANVFLSTNTLAPTAGYKLYPKKAIISATVDAAIFVAVVTGVADAEEMMHIGFCKAGTPLVIDFDGEVYCTTGGRVDLRASSESTGKIWGSVTGIEVAING